jgi:hypothetical protein
VIWAQITTAITKQKIIGTAKIDLDEKILSSIDITK